MVRCYIAHAMTGKSGKALLRESRLVARLCRVFGVEPLDPVVEEGVKKDDPCVCALEGVIQKFWERDKEMIRKAHVLLDITGPAKSEGVAHEIGYARYYLWKPVVRVWPGLGPSVARCEDDVVVSTTEYALATIRNLWGTPTKRFLWRVKLLLRSVPKFFKRQGLEIVNCFRG